eukprot:TRINITY_DN48378_c0_g1_i1.p1 TRINITY_DN48378_c0_g1~~TRINITY_DN48378_c0_g1_i1.p1  ORF type:complete len:254 (+),score=67.63 TRINITY_DN48378_c0_g1_i1:64-825(+)
MAAAAGEIVVRPFRDSDADGVREVFADGMMSIAPVAFDLVWKRLRTAIHSLTALAAAGLWKAGRRPLIALAVPCAVNLIVQLLLRLYSHVEVKQYVNDCHKADLRDIRAHYITANPIQHFWVAVEITPHGERMVGCCALDTADRPPVSDVEQQLKQGRKRTGRWGELRRMSVSRTARRRGVANKLFETIVDHGRAQKMDGITLTTSTAQAAAIKLYEKLGFVEVSRVALPIVLLGTVMELKTYEFPLCTPLTT